VTVNFFLQQHQVRGYHPGDWIPERRELPAVHL
jgi:hypothetical protein